MAGGPQGPKGETGPRGEQGPRGDSGIVTPVSGFYALYVDEAGNLVAQVADGAAAPPLSIRDGQLIYTI